MRKSPPVSRGSLPPRPGACSPSCRRRAAPRAATRSTISTMSGARCGTSSPRRAGPRREQPDEILLFPTRLASLHVKTCAQRMTNTEDTWQSYTRRIEELAARSGLNFHPVDFEAVPDTFMMEIAVYGLPVRMPHWSFGVRYIYQLIQRHMGHSRLFEVVFP